MSSSSSPVLESVTAHQLYIRLLSTASLLSAQTGELLRQHGISGPQYNVLRILRGAAQPLNCSAISERLMTRDPDVTRLLDRLEKLGFITRSRDLIDRRIIISSLTPKGLEVLAALDEPTLRLHEQQFAALSQPQASELLDLLSKLART